MTNKVVVNKCFGGGSGGMAADRALGEKNAMLGMGVRVIVDQEDATAVPGRDGKSEEYVREFALVVLRFE